MKKQMTKIYKILTKEPYKKTAMSGEVYDKCRYKTDSDALDLFDTGLEIGHSYTIDSYETEKNGRIYTNYKVLDEVIQTQNTGDILLMEKMDLIDKKLDEVLAKLPVS
jgi:hypothetical protein